MKNKNFIYMLLFSVIVIFIAEMIGIKAIMVGKVRIGFLPLVFALAITMLFAIKSLRKGIIQKIYSEENVKFAGKYLIIILLPLMDRRRAP